MNTRQFIHLFFLAELILSGFWYTGSAVTAMFLIAAGVVGYRVVLARQYYQLHALSALMLLYLLWLLVVAWQSAVPENATMNMAILAGLPVMYLFATNMPTFMQIWRYLRVGLFCLGVVLALWAMVQVIYHVGYGYAQGPFRDRNLFAALMNLLWFPAAHGLLSTDNQRFSIKKMAAGVGVFIISAGLFATTSRGGIATWLLLCPVLLWAAYRNHGSWHRVVLIVLIAALAYLCSAWMLNATIADRTFSLGQDPSFATRLMLWQSSLKMLLAHPLIGSGWGTFINYYPAYRLPQESTSLGMLAHNDYLQLALEGGLPALLLLLGMLTGVLLQLRRTLPYQADEAAFESVALLLGVLALFIHAVVNFIFYQAVMNILAGLYLARAAQLTAQGRRVQLVHLSKVQGLFRHLLAAALTVLIALPYGAYLLGQLINDRHHVKIENLVSEQFNAYCLAKWITAVQPQQRVSQETLLQTAELALADEAFVRKMGDRYYRELLDSTLQRFDKVRALNANDPDLGLRQARLLIRHHAAFDDGVAYRQAQHIMHENLKANPYHVDSIIALSHLHRLEGNAVEALHTLTHARTYLLKRPEKQLLDIELLRQTAPPAVMAELMALEKELRRMLHASFTARPSQLPDIYYAGIDARLNEIARRIRHDSL